MDSALDGLANPGVVDGVVVPETGPVELVLVHQVPWDGSDHRQILLQEKLNRYLEHVLDGELTAEHPLSRGRPWLVVVACAAEPDARTASYLHQAAAELRRAGGDIAIRVG